MNKCIITPVKNACRIFHRWKMVANHGVTDYFFCRDCGARKALQDTDGYQPIDWEWLLGKKDNL